MNIFSGFDGMSCGQIAAERADLQVDNYYASEIDEPAISVCMDNYPKTIQLGSILTVTQQNLPKIDLLIGGSPCQDISNLNKFKEGLDGERSGLFFQFWRMWQEIRENNSDAYFLLENVAGNKSAIASITKLMGVRPLRFDSKWVSAQTRKRLYWTNIPVNTIPINKRIYLKDILETDVDEKYYLKQSQLNWLLSESGQFSQKKRFCGIDPLRSGCLTKRGNKSWNCTYVTQNGRIRKLTPIEWERLQTVPDNYTKAAKDDDRYEMLGNGWTVDIIAHIFKHLPNKFKK